MHRHLKTLAPILALASVTFLTGEHRASAGDPEPPGAAPEADRGDPDGQLTAGAPPESGAAEDLPEVIAPRAQPESEPERTKPAKPRAQPKTKSKKAKPRLPTGHADCEYRTPLHEHVVARDEHLGLIAGRYGVRRSDLVKLNAQLKNPNVIRPGQKIRVCPRIAPRERITVEYVVKSGDNLHNIAKAHGLTVDEVISFQRGKLENANNIRPGQKLVLHKDGEILAKFRPKVQRPSRGRLRNSVQLPRSAYYHIKRPHNAYGTAKTIRLIRTAVDRYKRRHRNSPKVTVGDISRRGGGKFPPHVSHRTGRDVDLGYVLKGEDANRTRFTGVHRGNLDMRKTWALIQSFLDTDQVVYIFMDYQVQRWLYDWARRHGTKKEYLDEVFQYPRGRGRSHGVVRHWKSHRNHFHVRFKR